MPDTRSVAQWILFAEICGFFAVVFWKLLDGSIPLAQLLEGDVREPGTNGGCSTDVSPGRIQVLLITVSAAGYYLLQTLHDPTHLPDIPKGLLAVVAGSHLVYLTGKAKSLWLGRLRDVLR